MDDQARITCHAAKFGLIPHWAKDSQAAMQIGRRTYNASTETVAIKLVKYTTGG
jgi:putative SOS response-associated peptidase YedK